MMDYIPTTRDLVNCRGKHKFKEEKQAKKAQERIKKEGTNMRVYYCPHCYNWHLTKSYVKEDDDR